MKTFGIDLGGTNVRCGVVDSDGVIIAEQRALNDPGASWSELVGAMVGLVRALASDHPDAGTVGVGAAGLVTREGEVLYAPNIPGLRRAPLRAALTDELEMPVFVDNDANVAAHGELVHGAARGARYALVITLGTGIGGGIIARERVIRGAHGFAAEIGHFQIDPDGPVCACGERGHWEAFASGSALGRMGRERAADGGIPAVVALAGGDAGAVTGVHVGDAAQAGDPDARALLSDYAVLVAVGLAGLTNIIDPDRIVISGGLVELGDTLFTPLRTAFADRIEGSEYRPRVEIVPAELGDRAGVIGAAALARDLVIPA
ncbi:MAG: ROK family protein [Acidimicrobiia bacterium]